MALAELFLALSKDPAQQRAFRENPDAAMDAFGLNSEERAALKSGDPQRIRNILGDDGPAGCCVMVFQSE